MPVTLHISKPLLYGEFVFRGESKYFKRFSYFDLATRVLMLVQDLIRIHSSYFT